MTTLARAMTGALGGGLGGAALAFASSGSALAALYLAAAGVTAGAALGALVGTMIAQRSGPAADPERARWRRVWASLGVMLYALALPAMATLFTVRFRNRILSALGVAVAAPALALVVLLVSGAMAGALELVVRRLPAERRDAVTRALARLLPAVAALEIAALLVRRRHTFAVDTWAGLALVAGWLALVFFAGAWLERRLRRDPPTTAARSVLLVGLLLCLGATLQLATGHAPAAVRASRDRIPLLRVLL